MARSSFRHSGDLGDWKMEHFKIDGLRSMLFRLLYSAPMDWIRRTGKNMFFLQPLAAPSPMVELDMVQDAKVFFRDLQVWGPETTTESRLFVESGGEVSGERRLLKI